MSKHNRSVSGQSSHKKPILAGQSALRENPNQLMLVSFKDIDKNQGQTFAQWNELGLLPNLFNILHEYNKKTIPEAQKANFTIYGDFPAHSRFKHPQHVTPDAKWASMHVQGKEVIGGHLVQHVFYIVFLDGNHDFWPTQKKHT